jgi:hypothetical protein
MIEAPAPPHISTERSQGSSTMLNPSGDSPEIVALALLERIARSEGRHFETAPPEGSAADRQWILETYLDCLTAVRGRRAKAAAEPWEV